MILPHVARGPEGRPPIVLLHGFGGDRETWMAQLIPLETRYRVIAFDLPGHGEALDWPKVGHAGIAAEAVIGSLAELGHTRFHLVGHSMGGAVATIAAFKLAATGEVASLTLIAPGGFGSEIDARLLRRFAAATDVETIEALHDEFFGFARRSPPAAAARMAENRRDPRVCATLGRVADAILDGDGQKSFDLSRLVDLPHPIRLIWGLQDRVLPIHQSDAVPGVVAVHRFPGVGHMPHLEVPREVTRLIGESAACG